ncbi:MAG: hypothetical protein NTZ16_09350 [Verrucomicrobia bacterium]|nr:hypothetical protein [Verrucomicrobiota bacterium]
MKKFLCWTWLAIVSVLILSGPVVSADSLRSQTINLHKGWNAVFLQVEPTNSQVADGCRGTPITMVASYVGDGLAVQYVQNPTTNNINQQNGWLVWYAPTRPDAFLTRLFNLTGNKAYLVYSQSDYVWTVTGNVTLATVRWKPNSFNLVGLGVDEWSPPTFDQFFDGSDAHHPYRIYRLVNEQWVLVDRAQSTQMRSGEACWIYCKGSSDYQGPLYAKIQNGQTVTLNGTSPAGVLLANKSKNPLSVRVENVTGNTRAPLGFVLRAVTESNVVAATFDLPDIYNMPAFDANESRGFWLALRPERMAADTQSTLLKITTDIGTQCWLPVAGSRSDVTPAN